MVVIISRLFVVVVVVVVATLPSSFVAFRTKLRVVVIIFFWDECDDVLRSKEDSKKRVAREFNKDDDFGTQQGDAFMLFAFSTCESYARDESVTTRVEIRFLGKSLQKKKRQSFSAFEISSALEPSQLRRERRQKKQHQRQKQRQIRVVVFFIVLRVSRAFAARRRRPRTRRKDVSFEKKKD
jgi:hypothetical protein